MSFNVQNSKPILIFFTYALKHIQIQTIIDLPLALLQLNSFDWHQSRQLMPDTSNSLILTITLKYYARMPPILNENLQVYNNYYK